MVKKKIVTVFGSSDPRPLSPAYQTAYELGQAVAKADWVLCNGGYGGTMEAAAQGAVESGGHTIGVTCSAIAGRSGANQYIRQEIPTFYLLTRLDTLTRLGNAYVVLPGRTGTLLELAYVWELLSKRLLRRKAPIILLGDHWHPIIEPIQREHPDALEPHLAADVSAVMSVLHKYLSGGDKGESTNDQ
ncbi:MAG: LOG family protein [Planctomycetota bacterium]